MILYHNYTKYLFPHTFFCILYWILVTISRMPFSDILPKREDKTKRIKGEWKSRRKFWRSRWKSDIRSTLWNRGDGLIGEAGTRQTTWKSQRPSSCLSFINLSLLPFSTLSKTLPFLFSLFHSKSRSFLRKGDEYSCSCQCRALAIGRQWQSTDTRRKKRTK